MPESLQKDKIENLEKEFESQTKLINTKFIDIFDKFEMFIDLQNTEGALHIKKLILTTVKPK